MPSDGLDTGHPESLSNLEPRDDVGVAAVLYGDQMSFLGREAPRSVTVHVVQQVHCWPGGHSQRCCWNLVTRKKPA